MNFGWNGGGKRTSLITFDLKYRKINMSLNNYCQLVHKVFIFKQQIILKVLILLGDFTLKGLSLVI